MDPVFNQRYRLEARLGEGGMALVYRGTDSLLRRRVAIKVLREQYASDADFVRRFYHEAQSAARLSHPNVVNVFDVGHEGDAYFIVMELVEGASLAEMIKADGKLPERVAIDYTIQICQGLAYAHRQGFLHRDIKPANILVTSDDVVKLSDFGIARAVTQHTMTMTQPGMVMGSVSYFSPEQAQGHELRETSDLYSVGVVLFQLLRGELPYVADSPVSVALKHISDPIPEMDDPEMGISPAIASIVRRLLQKDPNARFQSASEVATALREARERPAVAAFAGPADAATIPLPMSPPSKPPPRRSERPDSNGTTRSVAITDPAKAPARDARWFLILGTLALLAIVFGYVVQTYHPIEIGQRIKLASYAGMNQSMAQKLLIAQGLNVKITQEPSESVRPDTVIRQVPNPGAEIADGSAVELVVSNGLPMLSVPDVRSFSGADAQRLLAGAKLKSKIVRKFDKSPKDAVISQRPEAGWKTRVGSTVTLIVSNGLAPVYVPNVVSMSSQAATAALKKAGLSLQVIDRQPSDNIPADTIASQDPNAGSQIDAGGSVSVVVSSGPAAAQVPDVTGRAPDDASNALRLAGFRPALTYTAAGPSASDTVISQAPSGGASAPHGSQVTIVVAITGIVPDVGGLTLDDAKAKLQAAGYRVGNIAQTQEGQDGHVVRTEPEANTTLSPGESVNIIYNPGAASQ